jgi:acyl-CoA hydrolase
MNVLRMGLHKLRKPQTNSSQLSAFSVLFRTIQIADIANMSSANQAVPKTAAPVPGEARLLEMVFPEQANHYGTLFGGTALALMAKAAVIAASRHARASVVMAASDRIEFHVPVRVGEMIELHAWIERSGRTSMSVVVDVTAETLATGDRKPAMRGRFEMVAVDANGRPTPLSSQTNETTI